MHPNVAFQTWNNSKKCARFKANGCSSDFKTYRLTYLTLNCDSSAAKDSLRPSTANFVELYTALKGVPVSPATELTLIM